MEHEKVKPSRRKFLKSAALIAGTAIGLKSLGSTRYLLYAAEPKDENLPWYGIVIDIEKCIGCGKCVKGCTSFGNGSLHLQIQQELCDNCNECTIARVCPSDAIIRVLANDPYLIKGNFGPSKKA